MLIYRVDSLPAQGWPVLSGLDQETDGPPPYKRGDELESSPFDPKTSLKRPLGCQIHVDCSPRAFGTKYSVVLSSKATCNAFDLSV